MSPNNITQGHLMEIEWLFTDVIAVGSPDRAKCAFFVVVLVGRFLVNSGRICDRGGGHFVV